MAADQIAEFHIILDLLHGLYASHATWGFNFFWNQLLPQNRTDIWIKALSTAVNDSPGGEELARFAVFPMEGDLDGFFTNMMTTLAVQTSSRTGFPVIPAVEDVCNEILRPVTTAFLGRGVGHENLFLIEDYGVAFGNHLHYCTSLLIARAGLELLAAWQKMMNSVVNESSIASSSDSLFQV